MVILHLFLISHITLKFVNTFQHCSEIRVYPNDVNDDDDDPPSVFIIQSLYIQASRFGPPRTWQICLNPVWRVRYEGERSVPDGRKLSDSDKFGDDQETKPVTW